MLLSEITDRERWDAFIDKCDPNTFLSSWAWSEVETDMGRKVYRIGMFEEKKQVGAFLAVVISARRGNIVLCPHGPVFAKDSDVSLNENVLRQVRDELGKIGRATGCACIRMCPLLPDAEENRQVFSSSGFRRAPMHAYSGEWSWTLDITPDEETLLRQMKKNTRYGVYKAKKDGVLVTSSTAISDTEPFWDLYTKTAERQGFVVYPRALIKAEFRRFSEHGRARWYFAHFQGETVSAALIVYSASTGFYHHGASLHTLGSITPNEALQWKIIQDAKSSGLKRYNFWGVVPEEAQAHPWAGLSKFKKGFGGYAEAYLHAQDFSLSSAYWITWTIETVRRWKRNV